MSDSDSSDITQAELQTEIKSILENASLENTSTKKVIQALEKKLGMDLSSKKKLIDQLVMDYVNSLESSDDDGDDESDKEEVKKNDDDEDMSPPPKKEDDEEWGTAGKKKGKKTQEKKKKTPAKGKKAGGVAKRGKGSGYTRSYKLSPELSELVGATELPRHEVVKRVWAIIKERQLIDPNNRQFAICDKPLYKVIGTQRFYTFGMMKYLKNHFLDD
ncbi:upstream activation factor subunit spp27 homolog Non2 [Anticarsia gemmatalis]|uniref:upstream activation factor subunit spp27 homolog Non2 n=1 Tax=Anticarsia gemmatalis TaxID=129554 RepID=UPI003F75E983